MPDQQATVTLVFQGQAQGVQASLAEVRASLAEFGAAAEKTGASAGGLLAEGERKASQAWEQFGVSQGEVAATALRLKQAGADPTALLGDPQKIAETHGVANQGVAIAGTAAGSFRAFGAAMSDLREQEQNPAWRTIAIAPKKKVPALIMANSPRCPVTGASSTQWPALPWHVRNGFRSSAFRRSGKNVR